MSDESKDGHSSGDYSGVIEETEEMGREHLRAPLLDLCIRSHLSPHLLVYATWVSGFSKLLWHGTTLERTSKVQEDDLRIRAAGTHLTLGNHDANIEAPSNLVGRRQHGAFILPAQSHMMFYETFHPMEALKCSVPKALDRVCQVQDHKRPS